MYIYILWRYVVLHYIAISVPDPWHFGVDPDPDFFIPDQGVKKHRIRNPDPVGPKKADPTDQDPEQL